jgi:site-specific DNA-cytosine methylase
LAVRRFEAAFVENVENLMYIKKGELMDMLVAVLEGLGYRAVAAKDTPTRHGVPRLRERAFISSGGCTRPMRQHLHMCARQSRICCYRRTTQTWRL